MPKEFLLKLCRFPNSRYHRYTQVQLSQKCRHSGRDAGVSQTLVYKDESPSLGTNMFLYALNSGYQLKVGHPSLDL